MDDEKPAAKPRFRCVHYPDGMIVMVDLDELEAEEAQPEGIEPEDSAHR